ncbi:MAG: hypothetical protein J6W81_06515 [Lentisphaeria bacterium]|nr:hypothetical protein [Lentisphaeria bacterium]
MRVTENLNGIWSFAYCGEKKPVYPFPANEFTVIPGCYDLMEPHCGKRGFAVVSRKVYTGGYVQLFIDGLGLEAEIFFDGKMIGNTKFAYMPETFTFDAGEETEHELSIVMNNQYNELFEGYFDFYGYGGVYGDVTLTRIPQDHLTALRINTEDYKTGTIRIQATTSYPFNGTAKLHFDTGYEQEILFRNGIADLTLSLPGYKLWSDIEPNLHTVTLSTGNDQLTETFGIREFTACGRQLLLNDKPVKLLGFNRHESHPEVGAAMPAQLIAADLRMLKNAGYNYIRGSHYPQRKIFLDLCDKMGFFVWEETIGWGIKAPALQSEEFLAFKLAENEKLTLQNYNHPCIIIRSFLNENESDNEGTRKIIKALYDKIRSIDKHTLITYASNRYEKDVCLDLVDVIAMNPYPGWYDSEYGNNSTISRVKPRLQELSDAMPQDKPYLITEIGAEAILGFRDPLKSYWSEEYQAELLKECTEYVLENEDCAGLSIWHFADTRSYTNGPGIYARARGFNNKGILDEYRRPKLAWTVVSQLVADYHKKTQK